MPFVDQDGDQKSLVVALGVYPHQEAGIGPNKYNFDDNVLYEIHVAIGRDLRAGRPTISYQFAFETTFQNDDTILISYTDVVDPDTRDGQNLIQTYTVTKVNWHRKTVLGRGIVPPNNQGRATPFYNQGDNGDNPAKDGVSTDAELDPYTQNGITQLDKGYISFAGQRDDGFFADVLAVFDLLMRGGCASPRQRIRKVVSTFTLSRCKFLLRNLAETNRLSAFMPQPAVKGFLSCN